MLKTKLKFVIAIVFLVISLVIVMFFKEYTYVFINYLFPIMFIYFVYDSLVVLFPKLHSYIPSKKHVIPVNKTLSPKSYQKLLSLKRNTNIRALITFILYFGALTTVGIIYLSYDFFEEIYLYILFLLINVFDYFCILVWCPFRAIILKNKCCYSCRITNWDRLMKFYILIFIPNLYTIILVTLGLLVFIIWEFNHQVSPERFYSISNTVLQCSSCTERTCHKKKEQLK